MSEATDLFRASRDQLLDWYGDHEAAVDGFRFPEMPSPFNWVYDWFDEVADGSDARALVVVEEDGSSTSHTFAELRQASSRCENSALDTSSCAFCECWNSGTLGISMFNTFSSSRLNGEYGLAWDGRSRNSA